MMRNTTLAFLAAIAALPGFCADWNPQRTAQYLDSRQSEWIAWKPAAARGGVCISCHTQLTYLLARPALRRALGENDRTSFETKLLDSLRARVEVHDPTALLAAFSKEPAASQALGVEAIFAALFLTLDNPGSADANRALDRMWSLQIREGKNQGAWAWFSLNLDPWETPDSPFYGAALAAVAAGSTPLEYRNRPEIRERIAALTGYLENERSSQPLHNRLMLLWASAKLADILPASSRKSLLDEIWSKQEADGGWTIESLGPWKKRPAAPPSTGSNAYATGLAAFAIEQAGVSPTDARLARALQWLKSHQDAESGSWDADSMNKRFEDGSMQIRFMRDAATGFAALALIGPAGEPHAAR
jgi:squalene-hopene/tetraprenyl-beta-curcumene cyclase